MTDIDADLKRALTEIDILLKRRQAFWETPRNIAILLGVVAAVAGGLGFHFGSQTQQISVHLDAPLFTR
jgi:hypothetical protein